MPHNTPLTSLPSPVKCPQLPLTGLQHPQRATNSGSSSNHQTSVATARAVESRLSGRCALNKLGKIMKILVELE